MARHQAATGGSQLPAVTTVKHADLSSEVVVECVLLPTNSRRRHRYPLETTLSQLASETEKALARPAKVISISRFPDRNDSHREPLPFTTDLRSLGAETGGFLTLEVALRRTEEDITQELPEEEGKRNGGEEETDKMTANTFGARERISEETDEEHGHSEGGACQLTPGLPGEVNPAVSIAIERWRAFSSESLLGFVPCDPGTNCETGTQTVNEASHLAKKTKFHTETQTRVWHSEGLQLNREGAVQMEKPGLSIDQKHDKTLYPKPYFTADALDALKVEKAVIMQAHIRGFLARRKAAKLRRAKQEAIDREEEERASAQKEHEMRQKRLRDRCLHPKTYSDFAVLRRELEAWRVQETARIKHMFDSDVHRRQAFKELLHRETELLQHIEELKLQATKESRQEKKLHFLETLARPFAWACPSTGDVITVFTPETMRAEDLRNLFLDLENLQVDTATRLDVLQRVQVAVAANAAQDLDQKRTVGTGNLNKEILELCRREIAFLRRGTTQTAKLSGLRQRLSHAFWYLLQSPAFNPQASRYLKLPACQQTKGICF